MPLSIADGRVQCWIFGNLNRHSNAFGMKQTGERECELPERETPPEKTLHLIAYHQATHKHPTVQRWLAKYPRVQMRGAPTSASRAEHGRALLSRHHQRTAAPRRAHQRAAGGGSRR